MTPRVLSIAGTDPSGGAGIQADLKTIGAFGGYGMAVVTALVAQNTEGVRSVHVPPPAFLAEQLDAVSDDVVIDAVKLGMLHSTPLIDIVVAWLERVRPPVVVLDPVMVATSGDRLLDAAAEAAIRRLCARVDLVTPNLPELAVLAGQPEATTWAAAVDQAQALAAATDTVVLLKGGHLAGATSADAVVTAEAVRPVEGRRVITTTTHGTGCSLSSAMATLRASGFSWFDALGHAKEWLTGAIEHGAALEVGRGNGPIDHFHHLREHVPHLRADVGSPTWTGRAWDDSAPVRDRVDACEFVRRLGDGTLEPERFAWYLAQDAVYLGEYAELLARAAALAGAPEEQAFWARGSVAAQEEEMRLHRAWVAGMPAAAPATRAYLDHLHAAHRHGYEVLIAALLPCSWLYADLGRRLVAQDRPAHPYGAWLRTYADPAFLDAAETARSIVDRVAEAASSDGRNAMTAAFAASMRHELAFFEAP
ncbi:bifunctional hydroxymethylpyrimidine kinase/phosphomethylpyrimidine kinase [Aeromicrobium duanguangcaii]|uniref:Bifunctional hydroxymethylpyrimidine kinase/phosphomethylpyrimidine kinase n=1 Tax=Aeromicrobium duanguangcaii TaxID=2968086 RepID=A0ABY5KGA6_9ACTN|nr:bifunctional hydroxymethylpyrimidine kinase/phosphomethylpyrimidine kinase [Aeromicrobium duanguangcaii]MCD9154456.1 bifunctional hydroxymethylpyrimidine kinase/phosphomethylpyrimidine kinase [Aeromicrobium duanguangcaii]MCL3838204.1 bifunctional hydroxymethylpyrimidine kinase/phosphomethylpyrimidine kinase [Aeromicrobium duanguangcaii]UUI68486.1 bifunctional hydroxymethylpyrimidine kinase/phosphomethylpyrimidine kinase [Aeromicrobium duanguangcaii]